MLDPGLLDPNVFKAAQQAGLDHVEDMNHNGKLDIQDVALMKAASSNIVSTPLSEPVK
jgi:purine nucleoside permease